jgi:hypothetical protein
MIKDNSCVNIFFHKSLFFKINYLFLHHKGAFNFSRLKIKLNQMQKGSIYFDPFLFVIGITLSGTGLHLTN